MGKHLKHIKLLSIIAAAALVQVGCSDGSLRYNKKVASPNITPPAPIVLSFAADPAQITAGGQTTLSWEVLDAEKVTISGSSADGSFTYNGGPFTELTGTVIVEDIPATTVFTLVASKTVQAASADTKKISLSATSSGGQIQVPEEVEPTAPSADPASPSVSGSSLTATATATVTVSEAQVPLSVELLADNDSVINGSQTVLRWIASRTDVTAVLVADNGETPLLPKKCEGTIDDILEMTEGQLEVPAASGCAIVQPEGPVTTYSVTVTDASGNSATDSVDIKVRDEVKINITATPSSVDNDKTPVTVSWNGAPQGAKVTVTSSPSATCEPALPKADAKQLSGSAKCSIAADTVFEATAEYGGETAKSSVSVRVAQVVAGLDESDLIITRFWAFEGEQVDVGVAAAAGVSPSLISDVIIGGQSKGPLTEQGVTATITVPKQDVTVTAVYGSAGKRINVSAVDVVPVETSRLSDSEVAITRVAHDPNDVTRRLVGVQRKGFADGKVHLYDRGALKSINVKSIYQSAVPKLNEGFLTKYVQTFPVNAIAVRPGKPQEIFVGTTGAVAFSQADGADKTWKTLLAFPRISTNGKDYSGSHPSCGGKTQTGQPAEFKHQVLTFTQVCDVAFSADGSKLFVATDMGVFTVVDVDKHIQDGVKSTQLIGIPPAGKVDASKFPIFGHVAHDVEVVDGNVFAATDRGVYVSKDGGESLSAFGPADEAFALAYHAGAKKLYVGTDKGVQVTSVDAPSFAAEGSLTARVLSLAVDPTSPASQPVVLAGTADQGMQIQRGKGWKSIAPSDELKSVEVRSVAIAAEALPATGANPSRATAPTYEYRVSAGTSVGLISGRGLVAPTHAAAPAPEPTPVEPVQPEPTPVPVAQAQAAE